jgi:hypothetical protein
VRVRGARERGVFGEVGDAALGEPEPAPEPDTGPAKSKGHVAFAGKHEYYRGQDGRLYKATLGSKINARIRRRRERSNR